MPNQGISSSTTTSCLLLSILFCFLSRFDTVDSPNAFYLNCQNILLLIEIFKKYWFLPILFHLQVSQNVYWWWEVTSKVLVPKSLQKFNVFSPCFKKSTKNLISQNLIVYDVLGKRKISYDQIRKGLKNLGVLNQLERNPDLFSELFVTKEKLTSEEVMKVLKFDNDVSEKNKEFLNRFLQKCSESKLQEFLLFVTASKQLPLVSKITVKEDNSNALFGHTCVFTIVLASFSTYEDFEVALLSLLNSSTSKKSFNCVQKRGLTYGVFKLLHQ